MRTCSLACSKRHKARAQCSGVRDPAAYVKKSELATPAAIDRDYNFLTAVERHLDRAEQDILERGMPPLVPDDFNFKKRHRWQKGEHNLSSAFQQARVRVKKAPIGLQRHKLNKTRLDHQYVGGQGRPARDIVLKPVFQSKEYQLDDRVGRRTGPAEVDHGL